MANLKKENNLENRLRVSLPWLTLLVLGILAYAYLFLAPYPGFSFSTSDGVVQVLYHDPISASDLRIGDRLLQVGVVGWELYQSDLRQPLFNNARPGDLVNLVVERGGETLRLSWTMPEPSTREITARLLNVWLLSIVFWGFGTAALLFVRSNKRHRLLFGLFNYITAIWLMAGALSAHVILASPLVLRVAIWLSMPIYLHLHWVFPKPLARLPRSVLYGGYGFSVVMALLQWFQILPPAAYYYGFLIAIGGSMVLLLAHLLVQREERRALRPIVASAVIIVLPLFALAASKLLGTSAPLLLGSLLILPLLPASYFYAFYHRSFRGFELRANRMLTGYIFLILAATAIIVATGLVVSSVADPNQRLMLMVGIAIIAATSSAWMYKQVRNLIERYVLKAPLPLSDLRDRYEMQIVEVLDEDELVSVLRSGLLQDMQIRQSLLVRTDEGQPPELVLLHGVEESDVPPVERLERWSNLAAERRKAYWPRNYDGETNWVQLVMPLKLGNRLLGLWMFGDRRLDDYYAPEELTALEGIAVHLALGLAHIEQTRDLLTFYQATMSDHEDERGQTASHLHNRVLDHLSATIMQIEDSRMLPESFGEGIEQQRDTIYGLEAVSSIETLGAAIRRHASDLEQDIPGCPVIAIDLEEAAGRYEAAVENVCVRIVEEALANTISHARAETVSIRGGLYPSQIDLVIRDDGQGFDAPARKSVIPLLKKQHYGLARMKLMAAMIGGIVLVDASASGTLVRFYWRLRNAKQSET